MGEPKCPQVKVQLTGRDGNAFGIIGSVAAAMRRGGVDQAVIAQFIDEATSVDYDHLLRTCMAWVVVS